MTFFLHTILLNIQINQQNVCQKQKNLEKASLLNGFFTFHSWHRYCDVSSNTVTNIYNG
ncbi:hypothetical protein SAMN05444682_105336 [Parapedobacter indicus]|uniref:Uncharacterized protein n=1 Tax=Parapedobacter indicus TaxID=1477437 RepID=A0A1I3KY12_9SPHI|nr:hypothetical protein CLV26_105336 [Parapedobacter indicus]SFI77284.1 hypothetical protein SAMN05444682_105336 [Parapedobacter indicus]